MYHNSSSSKIFLAGCFFDIKTSFYLALPTRECKDKYNYRKFRTINSARNESSLCVFFKSFKLFTVFLGQRPCSEIHFCCCQPLQTLYYYSCFSTSFLNFKSLWLIILWGAKHELYLTIALFKGSLSWSFSIVAVKNNLQPFPNLLFGSPMHSHLSIKAFTAVGKRICLRGRWVSLLATQNFWSECFKIVVCWPEDKYFHKSPQKIKICIT